MSATAAQPSATDSRGDRQLLARVQRFLDEATVLCHAEAPPRVGSMTSAAGALAEFSAAALAAVGRVQKRDRARVDALTEVALRSLELSDVLHTRISAERVTAYARLRQGLDRLRRIAASSALLDRVCPEVVDSCGFTRAILTRVENDEWLPWMAHFPDDPELGERFGVWMNQQRFPTSALGRELLRLRPVVVRDASADPRAYGPMIKFSGTTSFVAAPITPAGRLVGILYADRFPDERPLDDLDRDLLWSFAEDFGRTYERVVLIERMRAQHIHVSKAFEFAENMMGSLANAEIELARTPEGRLPAAGDTGLDSTNAIAPADVAQLLTTREVEVLAMMVKGHSNAMIAEQLIIKEGTVKSHVKHILRKLDAVNRAEAISRYIGRVN